MRWGKVKGDFSLEASQRVSRTKLLDCQSIHQNPLAGLLPMAVGIYFLDLVDSVGHLLCSTH